MRRAILPILLVLAGALAPAATASASPTAVARMTSCETAADPAGRSLEAEGRMHSLRGATRLQMRFLLQVRTPDHPRFTAVPAEGFGTWLTASPAPRRFTYAKRVENLIAPSSYRMVVRFRWLGAGGRRLGLAKRISPVCRQPDLRPDLVAKRVDVRRTDDPGTRRYVVQVANVGMTGAGAFAVGLAIGGRPEPSVPVAGLPAGDRTEVAFEAPACEPGSRVAATVDADGTVDERDETDDELVVACPGR